LTLFSRAGSSMFILKISLAFKTRLLLGARRYVSSCSSLIFVSISHLPCAFILSRLTDLVASIRALSLPSLQLVPYPFVKKYSIVFFPVISCSHLLLSNTVFSNTSSIGGTWASFLRTDILVAQYAPGILRRPSFWTLANSRCNRFLPLVNITTSFVAIARFEVEVAF